LRPTKRRQISSKHKWIKLRFSGTIITISPPCTSQPRYWRDLQYPCSFCRDAFKLKSNFCISKFSWGSLSVLHGPKQSSINAIHILSNSGIRLATRQADIITAISQISAQFEFTKLGKRNRSSRFFPPIEEKIESN
jgi:hypothetical protein